ncbi:MAG: galactose mutarotase, partial [Solobacterium sp.]|nr:galactose mutarotase [Solobacterium sp.]
MKQTFGREDVYLFTKENENLIMKVCTYGARLVALIDKKTGIDIVQGFDSVQGYEEDTCYIGAFIGRT